MELRRHSVKFGFLQGVVFCNSAHLCEQGLTINGKLYPYPPMEQTVEVRRGWFTKTLVWGNNRFSFFHLINSKPLFRLALDNRLVANRAQLQVSFDDLLVDIEAFNHHFAKHQRYLRSSDIKQFEQAYAASLALFSLEPHFSSLGFATDKLNCRLAKFIKQPQLFADKYNQWWQTQQLSAHAGLFDSLEAHPLTELQRQACVIDENNTLVIAGAGTGKTSTMAAKAAYLVKQGLAKPEEILMLAYGKDARVELEQRTKAVFEQLFETRPTNGHDCGVKDIAVKDGGIKISTFHAIGKEIIEYFSDGIATNTAYQPLRISVLASDEKQFTQFIAQQIDSIVTDPAMADPVAEYFGRFLYPQVNELAFKSEGQYRAYLKNNDIRALSGDLVKSFQELKICNYLYTHGIEFEYEPNYRGSANVKSSASVSAREPGKGAYQPDFYIPKLDAYLEHFGIDKKGNTRPDIDKAAYNQSREWKIALHQEQGTCLLQTFSWQANIVELEKSLEAQLCKRCDELGLPQSELFKPIAPQAVFEQVKALGVYRNVSRLMASFVGLFKSSGLTLAKLNTLKLKLTDVQVSDDDDKKPAVSAKAAAKQINLYNQLRWKAFLHLFSWVIDRYEAYLEENNTIDFSDMITKALTITKSKAFHQKTGNRFRYKYIMVDEFQDISSERAQLVKALRDANPNCALFCVGDDWQAIYRFAGSDLNLTTEFERTFGTTQTVTLDKTFRFNDQIEKVASRFIQANPAQLAKQLTTHSKSDNPQVCLLIETKQAALEQAFASIVVQSNNRQVSVMLISRFKSSLNDLSVWRQRYPQLAISGMSAHASKGKQADFVIVLDVNDDKYGFPSKIANDLILDVLLPKLDSFKDTEERRLFYVALSRAKQTVFVQAELGKESSFVKELRSYGDDVLLHLSELADLYHDSASCPECNDGRLIPRQGPYGLFYTCSLGKDYCDTKLDACPACNSGPMLANQTYYVCGSANCGHQQQICPQCLAGKLVQRTNAKSGKLFLACSRGKRGDATRCKYTCDLASDKQSTAA